MIEIIEFFIRLKIDTIFNQLMKHYINFGIAFRI